MSYRDRSKLTDDEWWADIRKEKVKWKFIKPLTYNISFAAFEGILIAACMFGVRKLMENKCSLATNVFIGAVWSIGVAALCGAISRLAEEINERKRKPDVSLCRTLRGFHESSTRFAMSAGMVMLGIGIASTIVPHFDAVFVSETSLYAVAAMVVVMLPLSFLMTAFVFKITLPFQAVALLMMIGSLYVAGLESVSPRYAAAGILLFVGGGLAPLKGLAATLYISDVDAVHIFLSLGILLMTEAARYCPTPLSP